MSNEVLFLVSALVDIIAVYAAARRGLEWVLGTIVINLILIGIFGAKLITAFGLTTNAGNVFYACVFLATFFIYERYGKVAAFKTIPWGVTSTLFFILLSQIAVHFVTVTSGAHVNDAMNIVFAFSTRVVVASLLAYIFAQYVNIVVYEWIRTKTRGRYLWIRVNGANILAQLVDSLLFFTIAFFDLSGFLLLQTIIVGWVFKTAVVLVSTPLLYLDRGTQKHS